MIVTPVLSVDLLDTIFDYTKIVSGFYIFLQSCYTKKCNIGEIDGGECSENGRLGGYYDSKSGITNKY